ncbi:MAG: EFR1 family ferrodoxin [Clostridiales bacterium]|nr:EFR1 family ferrodoxin [Clostridiales bacterium]
MRALFCVFSGTGNTLKVSERLVEELRLSGVETDIYNIRAGAELPETKGYEMLLVGYPVHAFNAPASVLSFLKKLPQAENMPAYIVRTSGEPLKLNDASGITPRRILKKRGYAVRGEFSCVMPYNIIFRHSDQMAARMWRAAELRIKKDAVEIAKGEGEIAKINPFQRLVAFVLRIEHTAMPFIGRRFRTTENCVGCGICAGECPQNNIKMEDGKPEFGKNCVGCMACSFVCPKDALKIAILNKWRVNGKYSFDGEPATDDEVCDYCKKAYLKYFDESENLVIIKKGQ